MTTDEDKTLVRQWFAEIDKGAQAGFDRFLAADYVDHTPPPIPVTSASRLIRPRRFNSSTRWRAYSFATRTAASGRRRAVQRPARCRPGNAPVDPLLR
jgi:hypothetical protein